MRDLTWATQSGIFARAAARLRHIAGTAWSTKRYLNIGLLKDQQMRRAITALASEGTAQPKSNVRKTLDTTQRAGGAGDH